MTVPPLFRRKLVVPSTPEPHIDRRKLLSLLQTGLEPTKRLTLVCGGPGYGKSTLVAAYLHELDVPACWYALDESDADLMTFLTYVTGALAECFKGIGARAMELARSAPVLENVLTTVVGLLVEEMAEAAEEGAVLVLDDFHAIADAPGILQAVELLVQHLPDNWQLLLTTRELPALPLPKWRVRQQLVEVGVRELRFSALELSALLQRLTGVPLSDAEAVAIAGTTDGWVASVILAWQAVEGSGEEAKSLLLKALDQPGALYEYLAQEVFSRQDEATRTFLLDTCLLPQVEAGVCRDVLGYEDASERLRHLIARNLLLPVGQAPSESYDYHPSFRRFLADRLQESRSAEDVATLRFKLARYLAEAQPEEALSLFLQARAPEEASRVLASSAERWIANNQLERLKSSIDRFPQGFLVSSFILSFYLGEVQRLWGNLDEATALFERAAHLAEREPALQARARIHLAAVMLGRGSPGAEALLAAAEPLLSEDDLGARGLSNNLRGFWAMTTNHGQEAIALYEEARACYCRLGDPLGQARVLNNLGLCLTRFGRFDEAVATYQAAMEQSVAAGRTPLPMTLNNLASIYAYQGRFQDAWSAAGRALDLATLLKSRREALYAHLALGAAGSGLADWRRAQEQFEACRDGALAVQDKLLAAKAFAGLAEVALLQGQLARAKALLHQGLEQTGLPIEDPRQGDLAILLGLIALENGDYETAGKLLDRLEGEFEALGFRYRQAQVAFYQARLAGRSQTAEVAEQRWHHAAELASAHGFAYLQEQEERHRSESGAASAEAPGVAPAITIRCFGEFEVAIGDRRVQPREWRGFKTKLILAYLLAHPQGVTKEQLTDLLYAEMDTTRTAILVLISRLRHALEPEADKQSPCRFIQFVDGRYAFNTALPYELDTQAFTYHHQHGQDAGLPREERRAHRRKALALYKGVYLAELPADSPWLTIERERYRRQAQELHQALIASYLEDGDDALALEAAEANLAFDNCCEYAHQVKMRCLARAGRREAALRHYAIMKQLLERELGTPPSPESQQLFQAIGQGQEVAHP